MCETKTLRYVIPVLLSVVLIGCKQSPPAPHSSVEGTTIGQRGEVAGEIKPSPAEPVSTKGTVLTPEEYKAREKMLEGTHLPGPMPPPGPNAPVPPGPEKGSETTPQP